MIAIFDKKEHRYFDKAGNEYPSVSFIIEHFGLSTIDIARRIHGDALIDRSAEFGTVFHDTATLDDQNKLDKCDEEIEPYLIGWRQYVSEHKPNFIAYELPLISTQWGFAGTPDRIDDAGKWLEIIDLKSGAVTISERIQTALYSILVEEHFKKKVAKRHSVHVYPFKYKIIRHADKADINIAKCILNIYAFKRKNGLLKFYKTYR